MNKIILKSGQELQVESINQPSEDKLSFTVCGVTDYNSFRSLLTKYALSEIKVFTGETLTSDYGSFQQVVFPLGIEDQEDGTLNVNVVVKKDNEIEARLSAIENAVDIIILSELGAM